MMAGHQKNMNEPGLFASKSIAKPDAKAIEVEEEREKVTELNRWRVPNTGIFIARVEKGLRMDDAFRVGDFIEVGTMKGMVEHISVHSLRLRHPRGMLITVPFGGLK